MELQMLDYVLFTLKMNLITSESCIFEIYLNLKVLEFSYNWIKFSAKILHGF